VLSNKVGLQDGCHSVIRFGDSLMRKSVTAGPSPTCQKDRPQMGHLELKSTAVLTAVLCVVTLLGASVEEENHDYVDDHGANHRDGCTFNQIERGNACDTCGYDDNCRNR
jgi:hypothetical protein